MSAQNQQLCNLRKKDTSDDTDLLSRGRRLRALIVVIPRSVVVLGPSTPQMHMQTQVHLQHVVPVVSLQRPFATANQSGHTPKCHLSKQSILTSLAHRRGSVKAEAAGLDEGVTASSGLLGPSTQSQRKSSSPEPAGDVGGVELASEVPLPAVYKVCASSHNACAHVVCAVPG